MNLNINLREVIYPKRNGFFRRVGRQVDIEDGVMCHDIDHGVNVSWI